MLPYNDVIVIKNKDSVSKQNNVGYRKLEETPVAGPRTHMRLNELVPIQTWHIAAGSDFLDQSYVNYTVLAA